MLDLLCQILGSRRPTRGSRCPVQGLRGAFREKEGEFFSHFWERPSRVEGPSMGHFTPIVESLAATPCVQVLECEQPTREEKMREKYKANKTVYVHVCLRMPIFLLTGQRYNDLFIGYARELYTTSR